MNSSHPKTIALAAPSRFCTPEQVESITALLESEGFKVYVPEGLFEKDGQLAGTDAHRAQLLNALMAMGEVDAILAMRGGYGAGKLLPMLRLPADRKPPILCGFSDVTAIHAWLAAQGATSLHSPVATTLLTAPKAIQQHFFACLRGEDSALSVNCEDWVQGEATGKLVGGNLSVLYSLRGTPFFPDLEGKILFLEDLDEMLYHLDRMLNNFALSGEFNKLNGLILGQFSDMRDNTKAFGFSTDNPFGYDAKAILKRFTDHLDIPVCFNFPIGHEAENYAVWHNREVVLEVGTRCARVYSPPAGGS